MSDPGDVPAGSATLLTRLVTVPNRRGLHARAAAKFVTIAERYGASVEVLRDGQSVSARSIMGLMMLGAGQGSQLEMQADGWDAKEALDALADECDRLVAVGLSYGAEAALLMATRDPRLDGVIALVKRPEFVGDS